MVSVKLFLAGRRGCYRVLFLPALVMAGLALLRELTTSHHPVEGIFLLRGLNEASGKIHGEDREKVPFLPGFPNWSNRTPVAVPVLPTVKCTPLFVSVSRKVSPLYGRRSIGFVR